MSLYTDLLARETEIIRILRAINSKSDRYAVIGGYAINALTSHRFSVDCDIATNSKGMSKLDTILTSEGYNTLSGKQEHDIYGIKMKKYVKQVGGRSVTVELFLGEVTCRQTKGRWGFDLIKDNSSKLRVVGATDSTEAIVPVKELLMAMKIHAGRNTDLRDVAMLSQGAKWKVVEEFAATGDINKVRKQIDHAIATIAKPQFASSLKSEFGLSQDVTALTRRTIEGLKRVNLESR